MKCKECSKVFPLSQMVPKTWQKVVKSGRVVEIKGWRCFACV